MRNVKKIDEIYTCCIFRLEDTTNKMTFVPSEDSDQPGHPPSLIRVFAVRSLGSLGPNFASGGQRRLMKYYTGKFFQESDVCTSLVKELIALISSRVNQPDGRRLRSCACQCLLHLKTSSL